VTTRSVVVVVLTVSSPPHPLSNPIAASANTTAIPFPFRFIMTDLPDFEASVPVVTGVSSSSLSFR
jgi:hypothetical protein